ncbi:ATP-binding protein [Streptomyces sp. NPDC102360]|uniref:ATP-binding protein n=1 Tax=Streptomyces sp. NPDC102360 TaxID=3366160 RepID=UPI003810FEF1
MRVHVPALVAVVTAAALGAFAAAVGELPGFSVVSPVPLAALALVWTATGATLLALRPGNTLGRLVVTVGLCQAAQQALTTYGGHGVVNGSWPLANWAAWLAAGLWLPGLVPLFNVLPALYPQGRLAARWWRWPLGASVAGTLLLAAAVCLDPHGYDDIAPGPSPLTAPGAVPVLAMTGALLLAAGTATVWAGSVVRLVRARAPERAQLVWLLCVVVPFAAAQFLSPSQVVGVAIGFLIPVAVAVGVVRHRLLGIEVVLRRGLVYGTLTAVVAGVYLAVTATVGSTLGRGPLPGVVAAALVAVGLTPARDRLQSAVDRLVHGERRDPVRAVTRLGDRVAEAGEDELLPAVLATVADALRAPGAALLTPDGEVAARFGDAADGAYDCLLPLRVGGRDLGVLRIPPRTGEHGPYGEADRRLLSALGPQVAVVVRSLEQAADLAVERDRVVAATRAERDRLRRDLHDGLGPALAGVALGLQVLRAGRTDGVLVARLAEETETAVREVRRILDDLRPAALDRHGLAEAVRGHAATLAAGPLDVTVDIGPLPPLPQDTEAAAYRIAREALTNTARHAEATHAHVRLEVTDGVLTVDIADDGHGMPARTRAAPRPGAGESGADSVMGGRPGAAENGPDGIGIGSMRRRAERIGGRIAVDSGPGGTRVLASLPLEARR